MMHRTFRSLDDPPKLVGFSIRQWTALIGASALVLGLVHVAHLRDEARDHAVRLHDRTARRARVRLRERRAATRNAPARRDWLAPRCEAAGRRQPNGQAA